MRAFVTGATGFVGSHLTEVLAARGDEVLALARRPETHDSLKALGATPVSGTLEDARGLREALAGVDVVYHVAGLTSAKDEAEFLAVNDEGTRRVLEAAGDAAPAARVVYVSSQAAVGPSPAGTPLGEDAAPRPLTGYGRSKLAGERAVAASGRPWAIVRPPSVYGPRDREFLQLFRLARLRVTPVFGDGTQELSLVFVRDLAEAIALAGTRPEAAGRIYHAAHARPVTSGDLARAVGRALGATPYVVPLPGALAAPLVGLVGRAAAALGRRTVINADKMAEFLAPSWLLDSSRAARDLGWTAGTALEEGLSRTARWYRDERWL